MANERGLVERTENESTRLLGRLGFLVSEARVYVALLRQQALTGYELAKVTGIPRANVYPVLKKLEQRGAAARSFVIRLDWRRPNTGSC
jgi:sugar-specific transcriptional regulator TrmB